MKWTTKFAASLCSFPTTGTPHTSCFGRLINHTTEFPVEQRVASVVPISQPLGATANMGYRGEGAQRYEGFGDNQVRRLQCMRNVGVE